ncbi:MAG: T9SS type A sorting domain-containing protein [Chitinophagales bacterium]
MKKITLVILLAVFAVNYSFAQIAGEDCKKTCEIEKIVQEGTLLGVQISNKGCGEVGVKVIRILENTAAAKFGLNINDMILYVDGTQITDTKQLVKLIATYKPSDLVTVTYARAGKEYMKDIVLGAKSTKVVKETICCDAEDKFFNEINVSLYPNPSVSNINLSMNEAQEGKYTFQIFDVSGKEMSVEVESFDAGFSKNIDLTDLSSGAYFLKITKGENTITKAFQVAK